MSLLYAYGHYVEDRLIFPSLKSWETRKTWFERVASVHYEFLRNYYYYSYLQSRFCYFLKLSSPPIFPQLYLSCNGIAPTRTFLLC